MLVKRAIRTSLLTFATLGLLCVWFYFVPRSQFKIGMTLPQIEKKLGHKAHLIRVDKSAHRTGDASYTPAYMISLNRYGVHLYLNADLRIIRVSYLIGSDKHPHYIE